MTNYSWVRIMSVIARILSAVFVTASLPLAAAGEVQATGRRVHRKRSASLRKHACGQSLVHQGQGRQGLARRGRQGRKKAVGTQAGHYAASALLDKKNAGTWHKLAREYLGHRFGEGCAREADLRRRMQARRPISPTPAPNHREIKLPRWRYWPKPWARAICRGRPCASIR